MYFINPTIGRMKINSVLENIFQYIEEEPQYPYKLIIGTDSHTNKDRICFVTAIIIHRVGKGARYFYRRFYQRKAKSLRQKIFTETSLSLEVADVIKSKLDKTKYRDLGLEVHVDIGENGDTRELIREVVGWVIGTGFRVKIKPEASGATKVADKYTK